MADVVVSFTEQELESLILALLGAISEYETHQNNCQEWKDLHDRLKPYLPE